MGNDLRLSGTQVIPTVGVEGENAERNLRSMLKHFRNLVDENASKATFLAAFKGKQSLNRTESTHSSAMSDTAKSELDADGSNADSLGPDDDDPAELNSDAEQEQVYGLAVPMEDREPTGNESCEEPPGKISASSSRRSNLSFSRQNH